MNMRQFGELYWWMNDNKVAPMHGEWYDLIKEACSHDVPTKTAIIAPRYFGKTATIIVAMLYLKTVSPDLKIRYAARTRSQAESVRNEMGDAGIGIDFLSIGAATGGSWDVIFFDDPVSGRDAVEDTEHDAIEVVAGCDAKHVFVFGTPWKLSSEFYQYISGADWDWHDYPAVLADGNSAWPAERSNEWLARQREAVGEKAFDILYLLKSGEDE